MKDLTREDLYELVWSKTMRDAAAALSVSDVGLKKRCRREGIPVPPQGYWNKVRAGHRMPKRPPLPLPAALPAAALPVASSTLRAAPRETPPPDAKKARTKKPSRHRGPIGASGPRRPRHRYDLVHYVLEIEHWKWDYDFGVHWSVFHKTYEVTDYAHLNVHGSLISPVNVAGRSIELTFIPDRRGAGRYSETPDWIGFLRRAGRGKDLEAIFPMPADMLAPVLAAFNADLFNYLKFEGEVMSRTGAGIRHYTFQRGLVDDELPPEGKIPKGTLGVW